MSAKARELMTRQTLAATLSVHAATLTKWEAAGMPVIRAGRGRASLFDVVAVRRWLQRREQAAKSSGVTDLVAERARKERAQAVEAEQRVAIKAGDLLPRDEVERVWAAEVTAVRTRLLAWPLQHADQIQRAAITGGVAAVEALLNELVRQLLEELSDPSRQPTPSDRQETR